MRDIGEGLADLSVGPFWITTERLRMTAFTVPLGSDKVVLVIKNPELGDSFVQQAGNLFLPFTTGLWILIGATIILASLLAVWYSDRSALNYQNMSGRRRRKQAYLRLALDSCLQKGMFFCSGGVDQDEGASLPSKILLSGFGCIILTW